MTDFSMEMKSAAAQQDANIWREAKAKFLELYASGTDDLQIIPTSEEQRPAIIVLGKQFPHTKLLDNILQFYSEDFSLRIVFPLIRMKGCHTFPLTRYTGKGKPFGSPEDDWEWEDCVRVE